MQWTCYIHLVSHDCWIAEFPYHFHEFLFLVDPLGFCKLTFMSHVNRHRFIPSFPICPPLVSFLTSLYLLELPALCWAGGVTDSSALLLTTGVTHSVFCIKCSISSRTSEGVLIKPRLSPPSLFFLEILYEWMLNFFYQMLFPYPLIGWCGFPSLGR